ncbi:MAG TPA: 2-C-methyl-D-erythritol 4-phosphate cytidylyltransferase [Mariprofundaceae bacterium]|nr:2-C-methyl-D-erythritol 4-phosphate cytidylyltransferase [Mariprofundaceae bacterium]
MRVAILLLAAGSGKRFGRELPKQYIPVSGKALLLHALQSLAAEPRINVVQPVIAKDDVFYASVIADSKFSFELLPPVAGGEERSISMQRGLAALPDDIDMVGVHDAARPLPSKALLKDVLDVAEKHGAAIPGVPVHDTVKRVNSDGRVIETPDRTVLRAVQTPQVARRDWFSQAIEIEKDRLHMHTDDASVLEAAGFPVYVSQGDMANRKITTQADMDWLTAYLKELGK